MIEAVYIPKTKPRNPDAINHYLVFDRVSYSKSEARREFLKKIHLEKMKSLNIKPIGIKRRKDCNKLINAIFKETHSI